MSKFYIKKKVTLEFLGEDYKDAYLIFKTVPVDKFEELFKSTDKLTNLEATKLALKTCSEKFVEGKFPDETGALADVTAADLGSFLDEETLNRCYLTILGQVPDPKS